MNETDRPPTPSLDGVLIVDKPAGLTSHDVVSRIRKIFMTRRVGHTGTLDPFATGVLVVCVNRATRLVQFLTGEDKEYLATMRLGYATDTGDFTGKPASPVTDASHITAEAVSEILKEFRGRILQTPPMYSAKKIAGMKLYEMARRGEEVERDPVEIEIKELEVHDPAIVLEDLTQDITFRVVCSAGAYIRTLAEDIGKRRDVGAHLVALRRTRVGNRSLVEALTLQQLAGFKQPGGLLGDLLIPMSRALAFPEFQLNEEERKAIVYGRSIRRHSYSQAGGLAKLIGSRGELIAVANFDPQELVWRPIVVLVQ